MKIHINGTGLRWFDAAKEETGTATLEVLNVTVNRAIHAARDTLLQQQM
jgi:hypothetical protein